MKYRGTINIDFTNQVPNEYSRLKLALTEAGWTYIETSSFTIDADDLPKLWRGVEIVAKQASSAGQISALTFHIQGAEVDFSTSLAIQSTLNPTNALRDVLAKPFPSP